MENMTTEELFNILKQKLIIQLEDNEKLCPKCLGLKLNYVQNGDFAYVEQCNSCYNGKVYKCEHCGKHSKTDFCHCLDACEQRGLVYEAKRKQIFEERLIKANVVKWDEYEGYVGDYYSEERIVDIGEYADQYLDNFDKDLSPKYIYGLFDTIYFDIDLDDVIINQCEDGYEDMYSYLNTESPLLAEAQILIDRWKEENKQSLKIYDEDVNTIVDLSGLYEMGLNK